VQLEQIVYVLVQPEERGVTRRRLEVLHNAGGHLQHRDTSTVGLLVTDS